MRLSPRPEGMPTVDRTAARGDLLAYLADDGELVVKDLAGGRRVVRAGGIWSETIAATTTADVLLTGGWEKNARQAQVRGYAAAAGPGAGPAFVLAGLTDRTTDIAVAPGDRLIAAADGPALDGRAGGGRVVVWRRNGIRAEVAARWDCPGGWAWALGFSPDGRRLAVAGGGAADRWWGDGRDCPIRLRDPGDAALLATLTGPRGCVLDLAFAPDGRTLYAAGADGKLRAWPLPAAPPPPPSAPPPARGLGF